MSDQHVSKLNCYLCYKLHAATQLTVLKLNQSELHLNIQQFKGSSFSDQLFTLGGRLGRKQPNQVELTVYSWLL